MQSRDKLSKYERVSNNSTMTMPFPTQLLGSRENGENAARIFDAPVILMCCVSPQQWVSRAISHCEQPPTTLVILRHP
jgi:hypothetical protein